MYIDFNIPIVNGLPEVVMDEIKYLESLYDKADTDATAMTYYMIHQDSLESYLKDCLMQGIINEAELDQMFKRFGWYR